MMFSRQEDESGASQSAAQDTGASRPQAVVKTKASSIIMNSLINSMLLLLMMIFCIKGAFIWVSVLDKFDQILQQKWFYIMDWTKWYRQCNLIKYFRINLEEENVQTYRKSSGTK